MKILQNIQTKNALSQTDIYLFIRILGKKVNKFCS